MESADSEASQHSSVTVWQSSQGLQFTFEPLPANPQQQHNSSSNGSMPRRNSRGFAAASLSEGVRVSQPAAMGAVPPPPAKVDTKPASDVLAGALARAASQTSIHPLDTLKVRMQAGDSRAPRKALSKIGKLIPPGGGAARTAAHTQQVVSRAIPKVASLYRGVVGAATGAGIAIGAYFACYGAASNMLACTTDMRPGQVAFVAGGIAAAGGSVVKVPLAVCIRSVQAGVYPNVFKAGGSIVRSAGVRGLFTGYLPTLLEDVPDMAFKFASYETLRQLHSRMSNGRKASVKEDFVMGAISGAFAAAATTPLDVIKTNMMCTAASRPSMGSAARAVWAQGGAPHFFRGVGARALSNGVNSAVFFMFFEALRASFARRKEQEKQAGQQQLQAGSPMSRRKHHGAAAGLKTGGGPFRQLQQPGASLACTAVSVTPGAA